MKKLLLIAVTLVFLQGCSALLNGSMQKKSDDYIYYYVSHAANQGTIEKLYSIEGAGLQTEADGYGQLYSFNGEKSLLLSQVVSKMADQLLYNFSKRYHNETIALTSIVDLNDHSLTNWLGQTVSELFIHELHVRKLRVLDFKLSGNIKLTKAGEFALTRDWKKLNKNLDVQRILTGTMSRNEEGIIFNIRIVNADSNLVESTSSAFVPYQMFVGGEYDYKSKKYYERDSQLAQQKKSQVRLVK